MGGRGWAFELAPTVRTHILIVRILELSVDVVHCHDEIVGDTQNLVAVLSEPFPSVSVFLEIKRSDLWQDEAYFIESVLKALHVDQDGSDLVHFSRVAHQHVIVGCRPSL